LLEQKTDYATCLIRIDGGCSLRFAQLATIRADHKRGVGIDWGLIPQYVLKKNLLWGGIQEVLPANHVGDAKVMVIHHRGQVVSIDFISAKENEIAAKRTERPFGPSFDPIMKDQRGLWGLDPQGIFPRSKGEFCLLALARA